MVPMKTTPPNPPLHPTSTVTCLSDSKCGVAAVNDNSPPTTGQNNTLSSTQASDNKTLANLARPDLSALEDLTELSQFNDFSVFTCMVAASKLTSI
jgi:hypothetical protein